MFVSTLIQAILLNKVLVLSKPIGTSQDGADVSAAADTILARQVLLLDEIRPDEDIDLIRLKSGMGAHVSPAALDQDEASNWDNPIFASGLARNHLGSRIFLNIPAESEEDHGESVSVP